MSFGKNPHVAKAEAAEQKAEAARDGDARKRAYLEAAHLWERAAEREKPGKKRDEYLANAERDRGLAEGAEQERDEADVETAKVIPFRPRSSD
ncbi:hypothetical protein [Sandaracinus amylolyticus]|uniref:Uncharacterized protein n=1 Tax=Sandaracinus amylolyticus TaxID=927083 RepID=A0A0F6W1Y9_9BACT|nr:hypothetical protein [Sandaracinus amylolyticus]AKF05367.1 hypothetical protein DB32_002516 [Sandaracinus amylolyticus]